MMITSEKNLAALINQARATDAVALDTEFVWERTYYPQLGLIQLALNREQCYLIDPCAISDLSSLGDLLTDPKVSKILHDAEQDLTILKQATGAEPQNIFDTRLAAGFAGFSATMSLSALLETLLQIKLAKTQTRTNWLKRPLTSQQREYAADDVRYLRALRRHLLQRVTPQAQKWLTMELQRFNEPATYTPLADKQRYTKVRNAALLNQQGLAILRELAAWREHEARRKNRPRGHIIHDNVLFCLAKKQIQQQNAIADCGAISQRSINNYGKKLIAAVQRGLALPPQRYPPSLRKIRLTPDQQKAFAKLKDFITTQGDLYGIDPSLLGNMAELKQFLLNPHDPLAPIKQQHGWRQQFLEKGLN